jgi:hypothetical protein
MHVPGFIYFEDGGQITLSIEVVWCTPNRDYLIIKEHLVALIAQLVRPHNLLKLIDVKEHLYDLRPKQVSGTPWRRIKSRHPSIGIGV